MQRFSWPSLVFPSLLLLLFLLPLLPPSLSPPCPPLSLNLSGSLSTSLPLFLLSFPVAFAFLCSFCPFPLLCIFLLKLSVCLCFRRKQNTNLLKFQKRSGIPFNNIPYYEPSIGCESNQKISSCCNGEKYALNAPMCKVNSCGKRLKLVEPTHRILWWYR